MSEEVKKLIESVITNCNKIVCVDFKDYVLKSEFLRVIEELTKWNKVEDCLPKHKQECLFKLDSKDICIGFVTYFEYGDSEITLYGKPIPPGKHTFRNWEIFNTNTGKSYEVIEWKYIN